VGWPGSGKDTWIEKHLQKATVVSLDLILDEMKYNFTRKNAQKMGQARQRYARMIRLLLAKKQSHIINATNISRRIRGNYARTAYNYGARVQIVHMDLPMQEILSRNLKREKMIPESYLKRLWYLYEPPLPYECHRLVYAL
jgi:predicted kinase